MLNVESFSSFILARSVYLNWWRLCETATRAGASENIKLWTRIQIRYTKHNVLIIPEILSFLSRFRFPSRPSARYGFPKDFPTNRGIATWTLSSNFFSVSIYLSFIWFNISYGLLCPLVYFIPSWKHTFATLTINSNLIETICVKLLEHFPNEILHHAIIKLLRSN